MNKIDYRQADDRYSSMEFEKVIFFVSIGLAWIQRETHREFLLISTKLIQKSEK